MATLSNYAKRLQSSRRLQGQLDTENYKQQIQTDKLLKEFETLSRSRKAVIQKQVLSANDQYKNRLDQNPDLAQDHHRIQKRLEKQKSKQAQIDFEKLRKKLLEERNRHDGLDKQYRTVDKQILELAATSKLANEQEERKLNDLQNRRKVITKLLEDSKRKELEHYDKSKTVAASR